MSAPGTQDQAVTRAPRPGDRVPLRATATVGRRQGTIISPGLWPRTWWVAMDHPAEADVYGCVLTRRHTPGVWEPVPESAQEMLHVRALVALRSAGVAP